MSKLCPRCEVWLPLEAFYHCPNSLHRRSHLCKTCMSSYNRERYVEMKSRHRMDDALYVLELEKLPGVYKIGHSSCPEQRRREFEKGYPSRAFLRVIEPNLGWAESAVQYALRMHQESESPSREWFRTDLATIWEAIRAVSGA